MATRRTTASGMLATDTKAPIRTASPPINSTRMVAQAMTSGAGTPRACRVSANPLGPLESFASPWAMNPYPTMTRNGTAHQAAIACWNGYTRGGLFLFIACTSRIAGSRGKKAGRMRELCRERVEVLDDWRRSQEIRGTCHECCRNAARQVRLASGLVRKRIKDSETEGAKFQREPSRSTGFVLDEWKSRTQELL